MTTTILLIILGVVFLATAICCLAIANAAARGDGRFDPPDELHDHRIAAACDAGTLDHRTPYEGSGAAGCRRSAEMDRDDAMTWPQWHPRHDALLASARLWDEQADALERLVETRYRSDQL